LPPELHPGQVQPWQCLAPKSSSIWRPRSPLHLQSKPSPLHSGLQPGECFLQMCVGGWEAPPTVASLPRVQFRIKRFGMACQFLVGGLVGGWLIAFLCFWLVGWWLLACFLVCWNYNWNNGEVFLVGGCLLACLLACIFFHLIFHSIFPLQVGYWAEDSASARYPSTRVA